MQIRSTRTACVISCSVNLVRLSSSFFTMALPQATKWENCLHKWLCLWIYWVSCRPQHTSGAPPDLECNRWLKTAHYYRRKVLRNFHGTNIKMHLFLKLLILVKPSTCFGRSFRPSSGAQNCTYGNRPMSNSCCYQLLEGTLAAASSSCLKYSCCRMCSFELLMMDGKTVRNM